MLLYEKEEIFVGLLKIKGLTSKKKPFSKALEINIRILFYTPLACSKISRIY